MIRQALQFMVIGVLGLLCACTMSHDFTPLLHTEPAAGATLDRAPRILRLYYNALPDVSQSSLRLVGPSGEHQLRGLHTMAADDLMIEIMDLLYNGDYTVEWVTMVGEDPNRYEGSFQFQVAVPE
ncbi:MAG: copper resistance protein CopC [Gammaproteobacteria bacterium]|nr:copper resistance protein CopC [Gammaproteobacteria bacterium]